MADGGAMFHLQRKVVTRVFTTANFKDFTEGIFHKYALRLMDIIDAQSGNVDMHEIANQYALQTVFDIGCGVPLESLDEKLGLKFIEAMDVVFESFLTHVVIKPYFKYFWWCVPSEYRFRRETKVMLDLVDSFLEKCINESEEIAKRFDILLLFIKKTREFKVEGEAALDISTL